MLAFDIRSFNRKLGIDSEEIKEREWLKKEVGLQATLISTVQT
jgi:hypothetical protein